MLWQWPTHPAHAQLLTDNNRGLVEVIIGSADGTDARIVEELANLLDDSTRRVLPVVGKGSLQNLADLKALRGIDMALVQTDVLDRLKAQKSEQSITYIAKLYDEEFHLLARSEIKSVNDLAGKKVNFGAPGDGTSVTGPAIFERLGIKVEATSYVPALALEKLRSGEIAALAYVAAKPAPLFSALSPRDGLHFLAIPSNKAAVGAYTPARLTGNDYPDLIPSTDAVDTVAVGTALMVANLVPGSERSRNVASFVGAFFTQLPRLQEAGHDPKWREVDPSAELPGLKRYPPAETWLKRNLVASGSSTGPGLSLNERELREMFSKFLDERSRIAGRSTLSAQEKIEMFNEFRAWQKGLSTVIRPQ
jgi:TRAP transporter TAXI family solute receptor